MINKDHVHRHADRRRAVRDGDGRRERPRLRARRRSTRPQVQEIGIIPVDAAFSPVIRVRYEVEETRVGQKTNYDKLTMEIWTNGSVTPEMALVESAKILRKHLNPFVQYSELGEEIVSGGRAPGRAEKKVDEELQKKLAMSVQELELSVRANNCLEAAKIETVGQLVQ